MVGFNALGTAQQSYWGVVTPKLAAPTPAPGDFLHPTKVDAPNCSAAPIVVGVPVTCSTLTVHDIYQDAYEQRAPTGWLGLHLDNDVDPVVDAVTSNPVICLLSMPSGSQNSCASLTWTPPANLA